MFDDEINKGIIRITTGSNFHSDPKLFNPAANPIIYKI